MRNWLKVLILVYYPVSLAQEKEGEIRHALSHKYNLDYRLNYFDKMIFKIDINSEVDNFYIPKLNYTDNKRSIFSPDEKLKLRFSFDYKFLGISYSFSPDFIPELNNQRANTKTLDLSFKFFYSDRLRQEVTYKKVKGFTLRNPDDQNPIEVFDDLEINTIGGKTFYITNKNFSYRAYESQTERQIKSAGSFMPSLTYFINNLYTNNPNSFEQNLERIKSVDFILQLGYMYNYAINKTWFATGGLHPGIGFHDSKNYYTNNKESVVFDNKIKWNYNLDLNFSLGYNQENFFSGIRVNYKNYQYDSKVAADIMNSKFNTVLFIGYRFNEVKSVKKVFEKIENKFGI
ncbi:hypothetical protein BWK63_02150 [Flavobacterium covae]|uniref:DUF4421 family protein n=1 Tax=Flavobacterium covae TaxID=2906076 RepID=A0ABW8PDH1_9FLAO|nr:MULTISPECIES: DUF4421 family protein [Flavobacterium]OWP82087.1 hypothetical protein BWK63_02150 [Flavobacterium covae]POR23743.1 hypothetical protein BWK57_00070 [Flavobacterium columnare]